MTRALMIMFCTASDAVLSICVPRSAVRGVDTLTRYAPVAWPGARGGIGGEAGNLRTFGAEGGDGGLGGGGGGVCGGSDGGGGLGGGWGVGGGVDGGTAMSVYTPSARTWRSTGTRSTESIRKHWSPIMCIPLQPVSLLSSWLELHALQQACGSALLMKPTALPKSIRVGPSSKA